MVLHVRSMSLSSDTAHPRVNVPFHVTLTIRVGENVANLPNVFLPTFIGPEELGDVRSDVHTPRGTLYQETLTLQASDRGTITLTPGYMDAIDARDGKPKRFLSNPLRLQVGAGPAPIVRDALRLFVWLAIVLLAIVIALIAAPFAVLAWRRRARSSAAPPPPPAIPQAAQIEGRDRQRDLDDALRALFERRTRACVLRVRELLWSELGADASGGDTLARLLALPAVAQDDGLRSMLVALERAAFVDEVDLDAAIQALLERIETAQVA